MFSSVAGSTSSIMGNDLNFHTLTVASGYRHCAAEAVRYLIEEEGLSPEDPLVVGLRQHLGLRERHLDTERILNEFVMAQRLLLGETEEAHMNEEELEDEEYGDENDDVLHESSEEDYFESGDSNSKYGSVVFCDKQETETLVHSLTHWASAYLLGTSPPNGLKRNECAVGSPSSSLEECLSCGSNSQSPVCPFDDSRLSAPSPSPSI